MGTAEKITLTGQIGASIAEVLAAADVPGAESETQRTVIHNNWNYSGALHNDAGGATTPAPVRCLTKTMTVPGGGSVTLDLTAAPTTGAPDAGEDLTGKKLMYVQLKTHASNNAAGLTIGPGAANGYELFGTAAGDILMFPDEYMSKITLGSNLDDVGAADCEIDFAGTEGDICYVKMAFEA